MLFLPGADAESVVCSGEVGFLGEGEGLRPRSILPPLLRGGFEGVLIASATEDDSLLRDGGALGVAWSSWSSPSSGCSSATCSEGTVIAVTSFNGDRLVEVDPQLSVANESSMTSFFPLAMADFKVRELEASPGSSEIGSILELPLEGVTCGWSAGPYRSSALALSMPLEDCVDDGISKRICFLAGVCGTIDSWRDWSCGSTVFSS